MSPRILCVEDTPEIGRMLKSRLSEAGYVCDWVSQGKAALEAFFADDGANYDLVILDLMLPDMDGLELCRRLRQRDALTPVIMVTARAAIRDVVIGLEIGADDYITKPFHLQILLARVQALLRRCPEAMNGANISDNAPLIHGSLIIDTDKHLATLDGTPIHLTGKEFALLSLFARHPGHSFSRGDLLDGVWGKEFDGYDHTVNTHINRLRGKIESDPAKPRFIQTVWGVGYRFAEQPPLNAGAA